MITLNNSFFIIVICLLVSILLLTYKVYKILTRGELSNETTLDDNELYKRVVEDVLKNKKVSTSYIQRKFNLGYASASRLIDMMRERGIVTETEKED